MRNLRPLIGAALALLVIVSHLSAQYYSRSYHNTRQDFAYYGEVVKFNDRGNLISGVTTFGPGTANRQAKIIRTDPPGNLTFGNNYGLYNAGVRQEIESAMASEVRNGVTGFAGAVREPGGGPNHLYYSRLNPIGLTLSARRYDAAGFYNYIVKGIYNDTINDQFLILGSVETAFTNLRRIGFILSVDPQTSNILWGKSYDFGFAASLPCETVDAVYNDITGEMVVVANMGPNPARDALVFSVNPFSGIPAGSIATPVLFGTGNDEVLNSVIIFNNPPLSGIACSGFSNANGDYDAWAVTGDMAMNPPTITSNLYDNGGTNDDNRAYSIIDRMDTGGNTTFFLGGNARIVPFGPHENVDIYKLDANLNLLANFMEGDNLHNDFVVQLGQYDGGTGWDPGLLSFGTKTRISTVNADFHINKFYFSGHIPCTPQFLSSVVTNGPQASNHSVLVDNSFIETNLDLKQEGPLIEIVICDTTVVGGSNAKTNPSVILTAAGGTKGNLSITLENEGDQTMRAEIIVSDLMGRVWMRNTLEAGAGTQTFEMPLNLHGQASGIYLITLRTEQGQTTKKLFLD